MKLDVLLLVFGVSFTSFALGGYLLSKPKRKMDDLLPEALLTKLPAWNCGLCGELDCVSFARKLAEGATEKRCLPGGRVVEKRLSAVLGRPPYKKKAGKSIAVVACAGDASSVRPAYTYAGFKDCEAAALLYGGPRTCGSGCLGFGTCLSSCPNQAISLSGGLARINPELCDGCGLCIPACPTGVIRMLPRRDAWYVACSSTAPGAIKALSCSASCTACGACERRSAGSEFTIKNNLAAASATMTGNWAAIAADCPTGVIRSLEKEKKDR